MQSGQRIKILGISFLLWVLIPMQVYLQVPNSVEGDRQGLMELYEATGGDSWANNSGWGSGDPSSSWHGIETDAEGRVTRIDLYDNGLNGELPESIGNLKKVTYLNVKKNTLAGEIPDAIGEMASLEWLILSGRTYDIGGYTKEPPPPERLDTYMYHPGKYESSTNDFSGTIPSTIGNLSNLLYFELSGSSVTNIPKELGDLSNLLGLYMSYNEELAGLRLPSELGNLGSLKQMIFNKSNLEGEIPSSFQKLTNLTVLHLANNNFTGSIPDLRNATALVHFTVTKNDLDGDYPSYFHNGDFKQLITLNMGHNNLSGTLPSFTNLPSLQSFTLYGNKMSGDLEQVLTTFPERIQIISIGNNDFSGEFPQSGWPDFYQLKTVHMQWNEFTGPISCEFWEKVDNDRLGILNLNDNKFTSNCTSAMNDIEGNGNLEIRVGGNNF